MKDVIWKVELFFKVIRYEVGSFVLKQRIKYARKKAGLIQDELDRIRS